MVEDHLKARYSGLFEATGLLAGLEQYEEEVRRSSDDNTSEEDQFDFLKEGDWEGSDGDPEGLQSLTDEIVPTASGVIQDPVSIPGHWNLPDHHYIRAYTYSGVLDNPGKPINATLGRLRHCTGGFEVNPNFYCPSFTQYTVHGHCGRATCSFVERICQDFLGQTS